MAVGGATLVGVGEGVGETVSVGTGVLVLAGAGLQATSNIASARAAKRADVILGPPAVIIYQPNDGGG